MMGTLFIAESLRESSRSLLVDNRKASSQVWNLPRTEASGFGVNSSTRSALPTSSFSWLLRRIQEGQTEGAQAQGLWAIFFSILSSRLSVSVPHSAC